MLRIFKQYYPVRNAIFVVGEGIFILLSVMIASWIIVGHQFVFSSSHLVLKALLVGVVCQLCLYYNDLYDLNVTDTFKELILRLMQSLGASALILALIYFVFPVCIIGRNVFAVSIAFVVAFVVAWRLGYTQVLSHGWFDQKIVVVGDGGLAENIIQQVIDRKDSGYQIVGVVGDEKVAPWQIGNNYPKIRVAGYDGIGKLASEMQSKKIVVAIEERRNRFPIKELLDCRINGIEIVEGTTFYEMLMGKLIVDKINPSWLIFSDGFRKSALRKFFKRAVDLVLSLIMLVLLGPILAVVALLIRLDSKGPVFFSQERVGENRKPYMVHKFRSMIEDAEKECGPVWAQCNDPRVTRVGRLIRKMRIDEFPQLFNVIKGEMSFVGPRPEREFFVKELEKAIPYFGERFSVKPGVTGWAQVNYSYGDSVEDAKEKLNYDLFYIKNMTIFMDLLVIMRTVKTVFLGEGAR